MSLRRRSVREERRGAVAEDRPDEELRREVAQVEVGQLLEQLAALVGRRRLLRGQGAGERELAELGAEIRRLQWQLAGAARESAATPDWMQTC